MRKGRKPGPVPKPPLSPEFEQVEILQPQVQDALDARGLLRTINNLPEPVTPKASHYIWHLKRYRKKHPDLAVVLYIRVSSDPQEDKGNLDTYEWKLRQVCQRLGIAVVVAFRDVISGWVLNEDRGRLIAAADYARRHEAETGVHTAVLAPCTDRFIRASHYNCKTNPDATPTEEEYWKLAELAGGVRLLTYLHPDMPLREVKRYQTKWGQRHKNRKGGRPKKLSRAERKALLLPKVMQLKQETGRGCCWIAKQVGVSSKTVWEWLKEAV